MKYGLGRGEITRLHAIIEYLFIICRAYGSDSEGDQAFLAYICEGIGKPLDWEKIIKYQRKNGSLFNSPSTTAFALTNLKNDDFLKYLFSVLDKFGNAGWFIEVS